MLFELKLLFSSMVVQKFSSPLKTTLLVLVWHISNLRGGCEVADVMEMFSGL